MQQNVIQWLIFGSSSLSQKYFGQKVSPLLPYPYHTWAPTGLTFNINKMAHLGQTDQTEHYLGYLVPRLPL